MVLCEKKMSVMTAKVILYNYGTKLSVQTYVAICVLFESITNIYMFKG